MQDMAKELLSFIENSPSCFHAIKNIKELLSDFTELSQGEDWELKPEGKYYVTKNDSSIIAFIMPKGEVKGFGITASHSDSPCFKIKANPEISVDDRYLKLNTEPYGGVTHFTWLDRPLSVAGRVMVRENNKIVSKLVDIKKDVAIIPSLACHMDRSINSGKSFNPQTELLPLVGGASSKEGFISLVAECAEVNKDDILWTELNLYNRTPSVVWGINDEFISSPALDDLFCAFTSAKALKDASPSLNTVSVCAVFDNEETGSLSKQGADSTFLRDTLFSICKTEAALKKALASSFMVSADNAHALHPNYPEKSDLTNRVYLNGGVVIKYNASQKYTTDGFSAAMFKEICKRADVPVQIYYNRSDIPGGSTLGRLISRSVSVNSVDIGAPQLSMHSSYETCGRYDVEYMYKAISEFYKSEFLV